jgi:type III secretory pathway component EscS
MAKQISMVRSFAAIALALVLGLLIDQLFQSWFGFQQQTLRIILQFATLVGVVILVEHLASNFLPFDLVSNVFFISVFLGVQQYLFQELKQVQLFPAPHDRFGALCIFLPQQTRWTPIPERK